MSNVRPDPRSPRRAPLETLAYRVDKGSLVAEDGAYAAVVQVHLQLEGYDAVPVVRPARRA